MGKSDIDKRVEKIYATQVRSIRQIARDCARTEREEQQREVHRRQQQEENELRERFYTEHRQEAERIYESELEEKRRELAILRTKHSRAEGQLALLRAPSTAPQPIEGEDTTSKIRRLDIERCECKKTITELTRIVT